jgi:diguanylate cyclase (GGDEF)-like protein
MPEMDNIITSRDVQLELQDLSGKDWQLWSIGLLVVVVLATGFVTLGLPGLIWGSDKTAVLKQEFLPQLISGFIVLIALLNIYLVSQKRRLDRVRDGLIRNLMIKANGETSPIVDKLTKVFSKDYIDTALEREIARADRNHTPITAALFDIAGTSSINRDFGILAGDYLLLVTAQLLKKTFRGADTVCRFAGDQFLVILPETSGAQAEHALLRVAEAVKRWNENSELNYKLRLHLGTATYVCGLPVEELLSMARTSLRADKAADRKKLERVQNEIQATPRPIAVGAESPRDSFLN